MKSLNQILKGAITAGKGVILTSGLIALLTCSCCDGSDDSGNHNPNGNSADAGYSNEGGEGSEGEEGGYLPPPRKDAGVNYNDANEGGEGEDVGEGGQEGGEGGEGEDASEGGEGGDVDGGQGVPPVVYLKTEREDGTPATEFAIGEKVVFNAEGSHDPDCEEAGTCGDSYGIKECKWSDNLGNSGYVHRAGGGWTKKLSYTNAGTVIGKAICEDIDDGLTGEAEATIHIK